MLEQLQQAYEVALKNLVFVDFVNKSTIRNLNIENMEGEKYGNSIKK